MADGIILTRSTLRTATQVRMHLAEGARSAGRVGAQIEITSLLPASVGNTRDAALAVLRPGIAFYCGFFPRYNRMMAAHGFVTEAAAIDGAGTVARFFRIILPLITPAIFFAVVLTLISSFQVFTQAYVLTGGGPGNATTTMVVYLYEQGFQFYKLGLASAVAWVLFIIILVITIFQFIGQKRWVHYDQ